MKLHVVIPEPDSSAALAIAPASAVVCLPFDDATESLDCHFEGNLYGASNLSEYYHRLVCAAGRLAEEAPTVAVGRFAKDELRPVAVFDTDLLAITEVLDGDELARWAGEPLIDIAGELLPIGELPWSEAAAACVQARSGPRKGTIMEYHTRAGQTVRFDQATQRAQVLGQPASPDQEIEP